MTMISLQLPKRFLSDEHGVMSYLFVMMLPVLLGMAALTVDLGAAWQMKRQLQNCVDAAALAGAAELGNQVTARSEALAYLADQGASCNSAGTVPYIGFIDRNSDGVPDALDVTVSRTSSFIFARFLGFNAGSAQARAVAGKMTPFSFLGTEPFGLQVDAGQTCGHADIAHYTVDGKPLQAGGTYIIKYSAQGGDSGAPGNFQPLALGGKGASTYRDNIAAGYQGWISSCDVLTTETGNMVGPTLQALDDRLFNEALHSEQCDDLLHGISTRWSQCLRVLNIAIIPPLDNGRTQTQVLSFGWFYLLDYHKDGNTAAQLTGILLDLADRSAPPEQWRGSVPWDPTSAFPFGVKLLE